MVALAIPINNMYFLEKCWMCELLKISSYVLTVIYDFDLFGLGFRRFREILLMTCRIFAFFLVV